MNTRTKKHTAHSCGLYVFLCDWRLELRAVVNCLVPDGFVRCQVEKRRRIVQDFPSVNCRSWPKPIYCFSSEKVTQNVVYTVLLCTMFSAFTSLVIFCRKKICRFYKKFLTFPLPCGIHKSGDGRHPSV